MKNTARPFYEFVLMRTDSGYLQVCEYLVNNNAESFMGNIVDVAGGKLILRHPLQVHSYLYSDAIGVIRLQDCFDGPGYYFCSNGWNLKLINAKSKDDLISIEIIGKVNTDPL